MYPNATKNFFPKLFLPQFFIDRTKSSQIEDGRQNAFFSLFGLCKVNSDVMLNHNNFIEIRILATDG